jgi:hypothetical protein
VQGATTPPKPQPAHITCRQGFPLPTCRRPRVICPLDGCFVLIYLEPRTTVFATSLISATKEHQPTVHKCSVHDPRQGWRKQRLQGQQNVVQPQEISKNGDAMEKMLISPRIHPQHRTQGQPGSRLRSPSQTVSKTIPQFRPSNARVIVSSWTRCIGETPRRLRWAKHIAFPSPASAWKGRSTCPAGGVSESGLKLPESDG